MRTGRRPISGSSNHHTSPRRGCVTLRLLTMVLLGLKTGRRVAVELLAKEKSACPTMPCGGAPRDPRQTHSARPMQDRPGRLPLLTQISTGSFDRAEPAIRRGHTPLFGWSAFQKHPPAYARCELRTAPSAVPQPMSLAKSMVFQLSGVSRATTDSAVLGLLSAYHRPISGPR